MTQRRQRRCVGRRSVTTLRVLEVEAVLGWVPGPGWTLCVERPSLDHHFRVWDSSVLLLEGQCPDVQQLEVAVEGTLKTTAVPDQKMRSGRCPWLSVKLKGKEMWTGS